MRVLVALLIAFLTGLPAVAPHAPSAALPLSAENEPQTAAGPVDWHPWFQSDGYFRALAVDRVGDHVLLAVAAWNLSAMALFVFDRNGTVLGNVSLGVAAVSALSLAVDPVSGSAFVTGIGSAVLRIDPATGAILDRWTIPFEGLRSVASGGRLYVSSPGHPIEILDASTGAHLGNLTATRSEQPSDLAVDVSGSWLFAAYPSSGGIVAVNLANGTSRSWSDYSQFLTRSVDGRMFSCSGSFFGANEVASLWPENGTRVVNRAICGGRIEENPVTRVLHDQRGRLFLPSGLIGYTVLLSLTGSFSGFEWTGDGRTLVGVLPVSGGATSGFVLGAWEGTPRVRVAPWFEGLMHPVYDEACFEVKTAAGIDVSSVAVYLDGSPTPIPWDATDSFDCVDLSGLVDGPHAVHIVGWDLLGDRLDGTLSFDTDGTPPQLAVPSHLTPATSTYLLRGWANDSHLATVWVNGVRAALHGTAFSITARFPFGDSVLVIRALDAVGNSAERTITVRYWPAITERVANATGHFSIPVPPEWTAVPATHPGGVGVALFAPGTGTPVLISVISVPDPRATPDPAYAVARARELEGFVELGGGVIVDPARAVTIAGHPAGTIRAAVVVGGVVQYYVRTVIVLPEWGRSILVTATIPDQEWEYHAQDLAWILEGMTIDVAPPDDVGAPTGLPLAWVGAGILGAAAILAAIVLARRRPMRWRWGLPRKPT